jgi:hypothetical protein
VWTRRGPSLPWVEFSVQSGRGTRPSATKDPTGQPGQQGMHLRYVRHQPLRGAAFTVGAAKQVAPQAPELGECEIDSAPFYCLSDKKRI